MIFIIFLKESVAFKRLKYDFIDFTFEFLISVNFVFNFIFLNQKKNYSCELIIILTLYKVKEICFLI